MGHAHGPAAPPRVRQLLAVIAGGLGLLTLVGLIVLWPEPDAGHENRIGLITRVYDVEIVRVGEGPCAGTTEAQDVPCFLLTFRPTQGPDEGTRERLELPKSATTPDLEVGDHVVMSYEPKAEPGFRYQFVDRQRRSTLLWLAVLFAIAVIALGRWRGVAALVGLGASLAVLLRFVVPALVEGTEPALVAIVGASTIAFLALYVAHGFTSTTTVALLGTLGALAVTVALAWIFTEAAQFSGFTSEEAFVVQLGTEGGINLAGLVLAGMVLGALGALDDVTVTQSSAVWELRAADPTMSRRKLRKAGLRVGRDHVASTVNTLALAYAGAALPLLILFVLSRQSLGTVANSEVVAIEIVATLVGSIGLVAAVPLTTWLAAALTPGPTESRGERRRVRPRRAKPSEAPMDALPITRDAADRNESDFWSR
jgi:uncharacterized membrane protein